MATQPMSDAEATIRQTILEVLIGSGSNGIMDKMEWVIDNIVTAIKGQDVYWALGDLWAEVESSRPKLQPPNLPVIDPSPSSNFPVRRVDVEPSILSGLMDMHHTIEPIKRIPIGIQKAVEDVSIEDMFKEEFLGKINEFIDQHQKPKSDDPDLSGGC